MAVMNTNFDGTMLRSHLYFGSFDIKFGIPMIDKGSLAPSTILI